MSAQKADLDHLLATVLVDFAQTLLTDFPIQGILDHFVRMIVDTLPISAAGVTLITAGTHPHYVAASDGSAMRFERLQDELGEGPCVASFTRGHAVYIPDMREHGEFPEFRARAVDEGLSAVFSFPLRHADGRLGALDLYRSTPGRLDAASASAAQTLADVITAYLLNAQSRTDLQTAVEINRMHAVHDSLTGLPNRDLLVEHLDHAIGRCRRSGRVAAVLYLDLDGFKAVNDTHGHHIGDELLVLLARRLSRLLRPGDTLARLSGDEFAVLCEDLEDASEAEYPAARINASFDEPFVLGPGDVRLSASIGIAFAGDGPQSAEHVLQKADVAMYQVKRAGGNGHAAIDLREQDIESRRHSLRRELGGAADRGELHAEYQPIVGLADGDVQGVEALLRWNHPRRGTISPLTAIPLAEQSGQIAEIGRWILRQACVDRQQWSTADGRAPFGVAVNVSPFELLLPNYTRTVNDILDETDTPPAALTLEVTETVFIQDSERAVVALAALKEIGVQIALDDFGTGYSSLSYLQQFPVDIVKIDRGFVTGLVPDSTNHHIVSAVVSLAHRLGMTVVAEGVETRAQRDAIAEIGCDQFQGYLYSRPSPATSIADLLGAQPRPARALRAVPDRSPG